MSCFGVRDLEIPFLPLCWLLLDISFDFTVLGTVHSKGAFPIQHIIVYCFIIFLHSYQLEDTLPSRI